VKTLFKKYFIAGALVLAPLVGTIWIIKTFILWMDGLFAAFFPARLFPGVGFLLTIALILLTGVVTRLYFGKLLLHWGERLIAKVPFGSNIYKALKQFINTVAAGGGASFSKVVLVEFPNPGVLTIGFVTQAAIQIPNQDPAKKWVSVFIPTTPNPTTGFLAMVEESKLTPLNMSAETAFKMIVSAGVVTGDKK